MAQVSDAAYFARRAWESRFAASKATDIARSKYTPPFAAVYANLSRQAEAGQRDHDCLVEIVAEQREVHVEGSKKSVVRLAPDAAGSISDSLLRGASEARHQSSILHAKLLFENLGPGLMFETLSPPRGY